MEIFVAGLGKLLCGAERTGAAEIVEALVAGLVDRNAAQSLPDGLVEIDRLIGLLVDHIDEFLHVVEDLAQVVIVLQEFLVRFMRQQDIAEQDGEDVEVAQLLFRKGARRTGRLKADTAEILVAVGDAYMGKSADMQLHGSFLIFLACLACIPAEGNHSIGGRMIARQNHLVALVDDVGHFFRA